MIAPDVEGHIDPDSDQKVADKVLPDSADPNPQLIFSALRQLLSNGRLQDIALDRPFSHKVSSEINGDCNLLSRIQLEIVNHR